MDLPLYHHSPCHQLVLLRMFIRKDHRRSPVVHQVMHHQSTTPKDRRRNQPMHRATHHRSTILKDHLRNLVVHQLKRHHSTTPKNHRRNRLVNPAPSLPRILPLAHRSVPATWQVLHRLGNIRWCHQKAQARIRPQHQLLDIPWFHRQYLPYYQPLHLRFIIQEDHRQYLPCHQQLYLLFIIQEDHRKCRVKDQVAGLLVRSLHPRGPLISQQALPPLTQPLARPATILLQLTLMVRLGHPVSLPVYGLQSATRIVPPKVQVEVRLLVMHHQFITRGAHPICQPFTQL